ncbi:MAG: hypothetical protein WAO78_04675 [Roseovarius sp.]|jgi:hypothetical protein
MAKLPNTIVYSTTGNYSESVERISAVVVGVTSATSTTTGNPISRVFPTKTAAYEGLNVPNAPREISGVGHSSNATKALTSGSFGYDQVEFMIRGVADTINGSSDSSLRIVGNEQHKVKNHVSNKAKGAKTSTAYRAGYFRTMGISGQRTNWSTAPTTGNIAYVLPTNNASPSVDQAQFVTYRAVPGELTYMYGGANPLQDEYKAVTG